MSLTNVKSLIYLDASEWSIFPTEFQDSTIATGLMLKSRMAVYFAVAIALSPPFDQICSAGLCKKSVDLLLHGLVNRLIKRTNK